MFDVENDEFVENQEWKVVNSRVIAFDQRLFSLYGRTTLCGKKKVSCAVYMFYKETIVGGFS